MSEFSLTLPDKDEVEKEIRTLAKPDDAVSEEVRIQAEKNVQAIMNLNLDSLEERKHIISSIENFGISSMRYSTEKNALLSKSIEELSKMDSEGSVISKGLASLQEHMRELDPSGIDFTKRGFLGKLLNPVRAYFAKYQKAQTVIANTIKSLDNGRKILERDNTTLMIEQQTLRDITKKILSEIELGTAMKDLLERQIEEAKLRGEDQYKIDFVTQEVLFPLNQRIMDLQQMVVVNQQAVVSSELVIRTNRELIRGVERAKMVTVSALRNAVMVASALANQKLVLDAIEGLNTTTANMISATSEMLKTQGAAVQQQAMNAMIPVETLKQSFRDLFEAIESIQTFKEKALPEMSKTIVEFKAMIAEGEAVIHKLEKGSALQM